MKVRAILAPCWFSYYTITAVHLYFFYNVFRQQKIEMKIPFFPHKKTIAFSLLAESLQFHNNSVLKEILNKKKDSSKNVRKIMCVSPY